MDITISQVLGYIISTGVGLIGAGVMALIRMLKKQNDFIPKVEEHIKRQEDLHNRIDSKIEKTDEVTNNLNTRLIVLETEHKQNHR